MSHSPGHGRSAAVFVLSSLPANARAKASANPRSVFISDLSSAQQAKLTAKIV